MSDARALVDELFPDVLFAFLGGSVVNGRGTPASDLDVVVVLDGLVRPQRESRRWRDWPVELFTHSQTSLTVYLDQDAERRRPTLLRMCADGVVLVDRSGGRAIALQQELRARLTAGPGVQEPAELDRARYVLTDLLDDLSGVTDPGERAFIGWNAVQETAKLALSLAGGWHGGGKWLLRELRAHDPALAEDLLAAREDPVVRLPGPGRRAGDPDRHQAGRLHLRPALCPPSGGKSGPIPGSGGGHRLQHPGGHRGQPPRPQTPLTPHVPSARRTSSKGLLLVGETFLLRPARFNHPPPVAEGLQGNAR